MRLARGQGLILALWLAGFPLNATAGGAQEVGLSLLLPEDCIPADEGPVFPIFTLVWGTSASVAENLLVETSIGKVESIVPLAGGLFRVQVLPGLLPEKSPGTVRARWRSHDTDLHAEADVVFCPHPAGSVRVVANPASLLAGQGQRATLDIEVQDDAGRPLDEQPIQLTTNVGQIEKVESVGQGRYRAVFVPPDEPFPQVAVIMVANPATARLDRVAVGRVVIPITARIELPGKTAPGTRMQMTVANRLFGPVRSDESGAFLLPVLVPPGYGKGWATSIDRVGNRKTNQVDLFLPETNQLGLWAFPRALSADGSSRSRLLVTTMDRFGVPAEQGDIQISASAGAVSHPRKVGNGLYEAYYVAPERIGSGSDEVSVVFPSGGSRSRAQIVIDLLAGQPARIELTVPDAVPADGRSSNPVVARVLDARGNPVAGQVLQLLADPGRVGVVRESRPGIYEAELVVEENPVRWAATVRAVVKNRIGSYPWRVLVPPDAIQARDSGATLEVVVVDDGGLPVENTSVGFEVNSLLQEATSGRLGRVRFRLPRPTEIRGASSGTLRLPTGVAQQVHWRWSAAGPTLLPIELDSNIPPPAEIEASENLVLFPPAAVRVFLEVMRPTSSGLEIEVRIVGLDGEPLPGRTLELSASSGRLGAVQEQQPGHYRASWQSDGSSHSKLIVTAVDCDSRIGAMIEVQLSGALR